MFVFLSNEECDLISGLYIYLKVTFPKIPSHWIGIKWVLIFAILPFHSIRRSNNTNRTENNLRYFSA